MADVALVFHHGGFGGFGQSKDMFFLSFDSVNMGDEGTGEQHGGIAAGHGQGQVVGLRGEQYRQDVLSLHQGQLAKGVAGNDDMCDASGGLLYGTDGAHALGAVAAPGEGYQKDLALVVEIKLRSCQDIGCGEGTGTAENGIDKSVLQRISDIG